MASSVEKKILNQEVIPVIYGNGLFDEAGESRFALGIFGSEDVLNYEKSCNPLIKGYLQLRANVYIDYANILGDEVRRSDGTELDEYDQRSIHFVAFERRLGGVAVVASTRLIIKTNESNLLPIELTFKDKLPSPVSIGGVEVSRFIVNHNEAIYQRKLKAKMIMAELAYVSANQFGPVVGMIEERFQRSLAVFGVSTEVLVESLPIEEGGKNREGTHTTELMAVKILTNSLEQRFGREAIEKMSMDIGDFTYWGKSEKNNVCMGL